MFFRYFNILIIFDANIRIFSSNSTSIIDIFSIIDVNHLWPLLTNVIFWDFIWILKFYWYVNFLFIFYWFSISETFSDSSEILNYNSLFHCYPYSVIFLMYQKYQNTIKFVFVIYFGNIFCFIRNTKLHFIMCRTIVNGRRMPCFPAC